MNSAQIDERKYSFRAHHSQTDYGLRINNRGRNLTWVGFDESDVQSLKDNPFYKLFVDWNGDVLFYANDWGKEIVVGNFVKQKLPDVCFSKRMHEIRKDYRNAT